MPSASALLTRTHDGDTHPVPYVKEPSRLWDRDPVLFLQARHWPSFQWLREQPEWPAMLKQLEEPPKTEP